MEKNKLDKKEWKAFKVTNVFEQIQRGKRLKKDNHIHGKIPYASSTSFNNGLDGFVGNTVGVRIFENCLTLANSGSVGCTFYQPFSVVASDHVTMLKNESFNQNIYHFIATSLSRLNEKYSFNREINDNRLRKEKLLLPIKKDGSPDYAYMEQYSQALYQEKEQEYFKYLEERTRKLANTPKPIALEDKEWKSFFINQIAEILSGKDIYEKERNSGKTPYISSTANNNGIGYFVDNNNNTLEKNCLSVNRNGSVGYSFYHPYKALFSNDCRKLRLSKGTKYIGLFISNQITVQKDKYGYGYKMGTARLLKQKIMLPITQDGLPDYEYMEHYMKYQDYKKLKQYLEFKKLNHVK